MPLIGKAVGGPKVGLVAGRRVKLPRSTVPGANRPRPTPDVNTFTINSHDPDIDFRAYFGDGAPLVIDGYGGWSIVARAQDRAITEWVGRNPIAIEIPFVIDNWMSRDDERGIRTENQVTRLEKLCGLGSREEPPICSINGRGVIPHDEHNSGALEWVVENVQWDRSIELRSGNTQRRLRCGGTITVRQYIESKPLERLRKKNKKKRRGGKKRPQVYIVKRGDSLTSIAAKKKIYGDASKWKLIAEANNIRDPRNIKEGQHLKIP